MQAPPPMTPDDLLDAKTSGYANALIVAIHKTATEMGRPDINAALAALAFTEAYLLSSLPVKDRLEARKVLLDRLDRDTADLVRWRQLAAATPAGSA